MAHILVVYYHQILHHRGETRARIFKYPPVRPEKKKRGGKVITHPSGWLKPSACIRQAELRPRDRGTGNGRAILRAAL